MLKRIIPLAVALSLCASTAFAAMPLITDDTGTQGKGKFQVELGIESASNREDEEGLEFKETGGELSTTLSYGLSDTVDLVAGLPWSWTKIREDGLTVYDEQGIGDLALQVKWRFFETEDERLSLALKPGISLPTGNDEKDLGNGRVSGSVMFIATHAAKLGALHLNLGYLHNSYRLDEVRNSSRSSIWHASLAGELNVTEKLTSVADIGMETNPEKGENTNPAYLLGGLIYGVNDDIDLDIGIKTGLNDAEADTALLAGVTMRF
jgi:hypothetical protein